MSTIVVSCKKLSMFNPNSEVEREESLQRLGAESHDEDEAVLKVNTARTRNDFMPKTLHTFSGATEDFGFNSLLKNKLFNRL